MIKKSVFEDEIIANMQKELASEDLKEGIQNLVQAANHLHSALEICEEQGLTVQADKILSLLAKIAQTTTEKNPLNIHDTQVIFGDVHRVEDDNNAEDLLNIDIDDKTLEILENGFSDADFEEED